MTKPAPAAKANKVEKELSPVQAAAGKMLDKGKAVDGAATSSSTSTPAKKGKYPSPAKYKGSSMAKDLNGMLDMVDTPLPGEKPAATRFMVGETALATAEAMSGTEMEIHPGWLLAFSLTAYTVVCGLHFFRAQQSGGDVPADGNRFEKQAAELATTKNQENRFAR